MTLAEFTNAIPNNLGAACYKKLGGFIADFEYEDELFCLAYSNGNWTLSFWETTKAIAIDESDLANLEAKIQELRERYR